MKSLATDQQTEELFFKLKSSSCYSYTKVSYIDDNDAEVLFNDHAYPIKITKDSEPPRYANVNHEPAAATVSFNVVNEEGEYSPKNTASAKSGILVRDRVFKFFDGKRLATKPAEQDLSLSNSDTTLFFMQEDSVLISPDINNSGGNTLKYFADLFTLYDSETYDDSFYSPSGYAVYDVDLTTILPLGGSHVVTKIKVTTNSNNGRIYYRSGGSIKELDAGNKNSDAWQDGGVTTDGETLITVRIQNPCVLQIGVVNNSPTWNDEDFEIISASISFIEEVEWVLLGAFFLDDPKFSENPAMQIDDITVTGRNAWKKALETLINIADLSSGVSIDQLIKDVADRLGITFTATSIADLSSFGNRTLISGYSDQVKASVIYKDIMQIIGATYRMFISDANVLFVQLRPTAVLADIVFSFKRYIKAIQKTIGQKQLQRMTIFTDKQVLDATISLGSPPTYATEGVQAAVTWSNKAISKYWEITAQSGTMAITNVVFTNTSAVFTTAGSGSITIQVKGNEFSVSAPTAVGEAANAANIQNLKGFAIQEQNPLILSDAEAKTTTESFVTEFGTPEYEIEVEEPYLNPLTEIGDSSLVISKNLVETNIFEIKAMTHVLNSETDKHTEYNLIDTGVAITDDGDIIYDRDKPPVSGAVIRFDTGYAYDLSFAIGADPGSIDTSIYGNAEIGYSNG